MVHIMLLVVFQSSFQKMVTSALIYFVGTLLQYIAVSQIVHICSCTCYFEHIECVHIDKVWPNAVHYKYPDAALEMVKMLSVERWTLLTLNGRHLCYGSGSYRNTNVFSDL